MLSHRAALIAVIVAFLTGLVASLALRPPGASKAPVNGTSETRATHSSVHWRLPVSFTTSMPVIGKNPGEVAAAILAASGGAIRIEVFDPGEIVPAFGIPSWAARCFVKTR